MHLTRREMLKRTGQAAVAAAAGIRAAPARGESVTVRKPNVVFVFADQWRAQATGYAGDPNVHTPHVDALARQAVSFPNAVSGCPVCSPYRGSLITGQRPLTHGVFVNDVPLRSEAVSIAEAFASGGYDTAYIGKWHLDGHGRSTYIPPERRQGFEYWKVLECTHDYNHSPYYAGGSAEKSYWDGYDAIAQTRDAESYIRSHKGEKPFLLMLSWGPPHNPYETAPGEYRKLYDARRLRLRPNVPESAAERAQKDLAGYYAHCSALDACIGSLLKTVDAAGIADDTIFVFTSDHGDMLGSQGEQRKQRPWEESVRVPFLLRYPRLTEGKGRALAAPIDAPDIMPTLLGLCGLRIPASVEGLDYSVYIRGGSDPSGGKALIACYHPFGEFQRSGGGREYRGLRTERYTYVKSLDGPWLLYDNHNDPFQQNNLANDASHSRIRQELDTELTAMLAKRGDEFRPGMDYIRKWGYTVDAGGTVPYKD